MESLEQPAVANLERWVNDVENAAKSGNWSQAISWSERALSLGFQHPRLLQFRALGRERTGRTADAVVDLRQAQALDPDDPGIVNALGSNLTRLGRWTEAITTLGAETIQRPQWPETWFNLGVARMAAGDLAGARGDFEQAVSLRPDFVPALGRLAVLATHRGDGPVAIVLAQRALALDGENPDARRAIIEAALADKRALDAELAAREWLRLPTLAPNAQSHAFGLLGDALELQARSAEAFQAYAASKTAFAQANVKAFQALDQTSLTTTLAAMAHEFSTVSPDRWIWPSRAALSTGGPRAHVFLMGFMRSGTTLLEQALSRHPHVVSLEETEAMAEAGARWLGQPGGLSQIAEAEAATLDQWRAAYWSAVHNAGVQPEGKVFIDKLPFNGIKLPLIARLFPDARIVFAIRDPRDVILSCFQKRLQPNGFSYEMRTLEGAARFYDAYMALVQIYRAGLTLAVLDHRHEVLVSNFQATVEEACHFIGLDFKAEMTDFHAAASTGQVMSQTSSQLRAGLNVKGLGRWRAYAAQMAPVMSTLSPWIKAYGYDE